MSGYVLHLREEENITLSARVVSRLIGGGNGDAALLYLAILRDNGAATPEKMTQVLSWPLPRVRAAEEALRAMQLVGAAEGAPAAEERPVPPAAPPRPAQEAPSYTREDVMQKLARDAQFASLLREVERRLGPLSTPSLKKLLGLYDDLGFPADVLYTLVGYCITQTERRFGAGHLPSMREIEKEGYVWARNELFTVERAGEYMRREQEKRTRFPEYMAALRLTGRAASPGEEKYLSSWAEMGFPAETVAEAYDRTVLHCHEFRWPYCNGILKRWHEKGLHALDEVRRENAEKPKRKEEASSGNAWMKEYLGRP